MLGIAPPAEPSAAAAVFSRAARSGTASRPPAKETVCRSKSSHNKFCNNLQSTKLAIRNNRASNEGSATFSQEPAAKTKESFESTASAKVASLTAPPGSDERQARPTASRAEDRISATREKSSAFCLGLTWSNVHGRWATRVRSSLCKTTTSRFNCRSMRCLPNLCLVGVSSSSSFSSSFLSFSLSTFSSPSPPGPLLSSSSSLLLFFPLAQAPAASRTAMKFCAVCCASATRSTAAPMVSAVSPVSRATVATSVAAEEQAASESEGEERTPIMTSRI
mmetsp:Transcript_12361/g.34739  ORF Transcript_12361/g.34739 Transcript_12361/m.34739 type:complete len:278 (-) Transcript_12361:320-1153(-)